MEYQDSLGCVNKRSEPIANIASDILVINTGEKRLFRTHFIPAGWIKNYELEFISFILRVLG